MVYMDQILGELNFRKIIENVMTVHCTRNQLCNKFQLVNLKPYLDRKNG